MDEMNKIMNWMGNDINKLEVLDQLTIMAELAKFIEKVKPIYNKYQLKKENDPIQEFLNSLFNDKNDEGNNEGSKR